MVIRGHLGALPKKFHPNRPKESGEKQQKTEKVGVFWLFFEDSAVPEGRILMRTKNWIPRVILHWKTSIQPSVGLFGLVTCHQVKIR